MKASAAEGVGAPRACENAPVVSWDDYRVLLAFERAGSLAKAAEGLSVDKATVGRRISALEETLGVQVVDRRHGGWQLTAHGSSLVAAARSMEKAVADAEADVRRGVPHGVVLLTAPVWLAQTLLLPRMEAFRASHPGLELELIVTNAVLDLEKREAEIAVRNIRPEQASFVSRKLGVLGSALYGSRDYVARRGCPTDREELGGHAFVAYQARVSFCAELEWLDAAGLSVAFRASDTIVLLDAAVAGLGLAVLPCWLADRRDALVRVPAVDRTVDDIFVCFPESLRRLPRIQAVSGWLADVWALEQPGLAGEVPQAPPAAEERVPGETTRR